MCAKIIHATSSSRGPSVTISQSSTATGRKSRYKTLPTRASPQSSTGSPAATSSGQLSSSQSTVRSSNGDRPMSGTAKSYQDRTQLKCLRRAVSPFWSSARKPKVLSAFGIECSNASTETVASCSSRWRSAGASANQLPPNVYGMTSGGTTPSTKSIKKNGVPKTSPVCSSQRTRGTGTSVSSPTFRITPNWWSSRYVGNTWTSSAVGATRATSFCVTGRPSSSQRAVKMMVSDDMPVESTPLSTVTCGIAPPGRTVDSHCDITDGRVVTSRLERWSRSTLSSTGSLGTGASFVRQLRYGG